MANTKLDSATDKPSTTQPGDGPADTTDPTEHASSATPDKAAAAKSGAGTVNAVVPVDGPPKAPKKGDKARTEKYEAVKPDGTKVTVTRNIETGESKVS